jgi:hypothetical protein
MSESGCSSFYGNIGERRDEISWLEMRNVISEITGLKFFIEKCNNDVNSCMSFAVSAWISPGAEDIISKYHVQNILPAGFGSGMVGMCLKSGETVWGLHFPLDFKGDGEKNNNYIAMVELQKVMKAYPGSICAMGDFNTIPGKIELVNILLSPMLIT